MKVCAAPLFSTVFAILAVPPTAFPQQSIHFDRISLEQGLSQSSILGITQDPQGFMWFATQDGVNRFDGYTFKVFRQDLADSNSLSNNFCTSLVADHRGFIWISTSASGLDRYDPRTDTFRNFRHNPSDPQSLSFDAVGPLVEDASGMIWVGTRRGLNLLNPETGTVRRFMHAPRDSTTIPSNLITRIFRDRNDRIWIGTDRGACTYDEQRQEFIRYRINATEHLVQGFAEDQNGNLWMTMSRGLFVLDKAENRFRRSDAFFDGKDLGFVLSDGNGTLWISSFIGLVEFRPSSGLIKVHKHRPLDPFSPSSNAFTTACRDRSGVLWFGSFNGINRFAPRKIKFKTYRHIESDLGSISESNVRSFSEDHAGTLWIATMNGLNRFSERTGSFGRYRAVQGGLSSNIIWALREENRGARSTVWAGTNSHGINEITFSREEKPKFRYHLSGRSIASLAVSSSGDVWAGDLNGELYRYDPRTRKFGIIDTSNHQRLVALYEARNGDLWIGTLGNGAGRLDPSTGEIQRFRHNPSDPSSLSNDHAISFHEDGNSNIWIGTYAGLNKFSESDSSFRRYITSDGLPNDVIYGILGDDRGHLWLSTNKGLSRFDPIAETFRNFDVSDGLQGNEFNQGSVYRARNGMMYFGGINGFSMFHPDSVHDNPHAPPVILTDFKIFNRSARNDEEKKGRITGPIEYVKEIRLTYNENVFSFEYAALEFTSPGKNRYAYMIEGFDEGWVDAGVRREATYTNLDPGEYTFRVKASNNDGVWNEDGTSIAIVITPPFWMTWWFRGILILGFLSVGPIIYFRRVGALRNEHKLQEELSRKLIDSQEAERKRIAAELHDSVGQDLLIIRNKILLGLDAGTDSEDRNHEFQDAADYVSKSLKHVREISRNLRPVQLDQLGLSAAIESVVETVAGAAQLDHSLHIDNVDGFLKKESEIHVFRIVQEALNNVVKHAGKCTFSVELLLLQDVLVVHIGDTGAGLDMSRRSRAGGLGLSGMAERAKILGGELTLDSNPGKGTTVTVTIPFG